MSYQSFLIAPFQTGLDTDLKPWLLPQDAFEKIENGHIEHGRIEKRSGYSTLADLVENNGSDWAVSGISAATPAVVTVSSTAGLANGNQIEVRGAGGVTNINGIKFLVSALTGTTFALTDLDGNNITATGAYTSGGDVFLVTQERVMGLLSYVDSGNVKQLLGFNKTRACIYDGTNERFNALDEADIFTGEDTDYIWGANWASTASTTASSLYRLYFSNGKSNGGGTTDGIRFYDPATSTTATTQFNPTINSATEIRGCKLLFSFKQRLLLLNTFEGGNSYPQRARWSQEQNPGTPGAFNGEWDDNVAGKGGYVDAPTGDQIISARFLQDLIIVFFTNSVWTLRPVPDPALPFRWDKINDYRACASKTASSGFDRYVVGTGVRGITGTDGVETRRVDERIEDFVKTEVNNSESDKIFMQRSYDSRKMWMLYPSEESEENDSSLILDEESGSYSLYKISMNVLGYGSVNADAALSDFTEAAALSGIRAEDIDQQGDLQINSFFFDGGDETFVGGNTDGSVFILDNGASDDGNSIDFTLTSAAWNPYKEQGKEAQLGYIDLFLENNDTTTFKVEFFKNNVFYPYSESTINCLPDIGEIATIVDIEILSPSTSGVSVSSPSHGLTSGDEIYIYLVEGMRSINGGAHEIVVIDENTFTISIDASDFNNYSSGGVITLRSLYFTRSWKRVYAGGIGYQHKVKITSVGTNKPFTIHALMPWFRQRGRRMI